jgi:hypothetical protein
VGIGSVETNADGCLLRNDRCSVKQTKMKTPESPSFVTL